MIKMFIGLRVKYRHACPIEMKLGFSRHIFLKNNQTSNFMEFRPVGADLF